MHDDPLIIARVLFWLFAVGVLVLPIRWSFFCFLLASHMDITSLSFNSATTVGIENTIRIAALPAILCFRAGFSFRQFPWTLPQKFWLALVAYAAIAAAWGGYALPAAKMVTYLTAYLVLYLVFCQAWVEGWVDLALIRLSAWCAVALAVIQTFTLGNMWGGLELRFTSFSSPQYFAACLVALLAVLVFSGSSGFFHYVTCGLLVIAILFSGSRYVFISTAVLLLIASFRVSGVEKSLIFKFSVRKMLITLGVGAIAAAAVLTYLPGNRIDELVFAVSNDDTKVEDVGTLAWRLGIYEDIWSRLQKRSAVGLIFGSGTSSGAALMLDHDPTHYDQVGIDANRILHSEYLRAFYEWGILGLALLVGFLVTTILGFVRKITAEGGGPALAFFGALPSILIGLAIENVLAGAVSAAGVGIVLAMSFAWQMGPEYSHESTEQEAEGFASDQAALSGMS
jgi:O-antigen ligase